MDAGSIFVGVGGLVAAVGAIVSPFVLLRYKRQEKLDDWKRQDEVADRLLAEQKKTTAGTIEVARRVEIQTETANGQLEAIASQAKSIHTLVNQEKTERLESEHMDKVA